MPSSEWPYSIAHDNAEMKANILAFNEEEYVKKVKEHHTMAGSYETSESCAKLIEMIEK